MIDDYGPNLEHFYDRNIPDHGDSYPENYDKLYDDNEYTNEDNFKQKRYVRRATKERRSVTCDLDTTRSSRTLEGSKDSRTSSWTSVSRSSRRSNASGLVIREPSFLDAFRVMYLSRRISSTKSNNEYLATNSKYEQIKKCLKRDGLGSKKWHLYPRRKISTSGSSREDTLVEQFDRRVKVDEEFLKKYKKGVKFTKEDTPLAKLKRWELSLYQKLGFIQAI